LLKKQKLMYVCNLININHISCNGKTLPLQYIKDVTFGNILIFVMTNFPYKEKDATDNKAVQRNVGP
jgi:hypothetical protein